MQTGRYFLFLIIVLFLEATAASAQLRVRVKFSELPNLTYQLDCVAEVPVNCSRKNLGDLWTREFLKTDDDRRLLKEWTRLRDLYTGDFQFSKAPAANDSSVNLFDKIRIAGFQAENVDDYLARLDLLTAPGDRSQFEIIIRHFEPNFKTWWDREAAPAGGSFANQTEALLRAPSITQPLAQFNDFYASVLPADYQVTFNLFYIPNTIKESTNGQQIENYSLMEFKAQERPSDRIDVAVHELCHFFYANRNAENHARLEQRFYAANRPAAIPAYNLLNEALAAAFGNGMIDRAITPPADFARYLAAKKSFYNNDAIDRAAKALLPILDARLKNKQTIDDPAFVTDYISALEKEFGSELLKPRLYLSEMFLFADEKYGVSLRRDVRHTLDTASFYAAEGSWTDENILGDYQSHPRLNSVFIVHPDNFDELIKNKIVTLAQLKDIKAAYDTNGEVLYATTRAPFTYVYIAAAKDADGAKRLIQTLADAAQFEGVYQPSKVN